MRKAQHDFKVGFTRKWTAQLIRSKIRNKGNCRDEKEPILLFIVWQMIPNISIKPVKLHSHCRYNRFQRFSNYDDSENE